MRKIIIAMLMALPFVSCNPNPYLHPPVLSVNIFILVENEVGKNLLDPEFDGNVLDDDISIEYAGETFILNDQDNVTMNFELRDAPPQHG